MEFGSGFDQESIGQIKVFLRLWEHKRRDSKPALDTVKIPDFQKPKYFAHTSPTARFSGLVW